MSHTNNHNYRSLQRLGLDHDAPTSTPYQPSFNQPRQNKTYSNNDNGQEVREYSGGATAVASVIIFLFVLAALLCLQVGRLRKTSSSSQRNSNSASDGNTVASLEDDLDQEDNDDDDMKDVEQGTNETMTQASDDKSAISLENENAEET